MAMEKKCQAQYVGPQPTTFVFVQACEEHDQQGPGTPNKPVLNGWKW